MQQQNPFMREAIKEAILAGDEGEVPIGCVIVKDNKIIARSHNQRESNQLSINHAEILAIKRACEELNTWRLLDCDMYVTLEPCTMCAGAIINSRIKRLYFGAFDQEAGAAGSVLDIFQIKQINHTVEVYKGIDELTCSILLKEFFNNLRLYKRE